MSQCNLCCYHLFYLLAVVKRELDVFEGSADN